MPLKGLIDVMIKAAALKQQGLLYCVILKLTFISSSSVWNPFGLQLTAIFVFPIRSQRIWVKCTVKWSLSTASSTATRTRGTCWSESVLAARRRRSFCSITACIRWESPGCRTQTQGIFFSYCSPFFMLPAEARWSSAHTSHVHVKNTHW